ncbi:MAG: aldehyde dehydrogenase (NADP(+)) [Bacteroidota bacterium]
MPTPTFQANSPIDNQLLPGEFPIASQVEIGQVVEQANKAFEIYRKKSGEEIAAFLDQAAEEIENLGDELLERCHLETALPIGRLTGERGRTCNQLRLFASVVREGSWVDARIDPAQPDRKPFPKVDIRHMNIPLGAVAVFGASNFPLAFSTAGGDTASALASGCPVIVKGHPAHPGTAQLVAKAMATAAEKTGMPEGVFSLVQGNTFEVGEYLVKHPMIKAVGFTGSLRGGKAIMEYVQTREEPIPVFAEMGSINPVFILPEAMKKRTEAIATGLAGSINLGVGQFCTNPGVAFIQNDDQGKEFSSLLTAKIQEMPATTMLTAGIKAAYDSGLGYLSSHAESLAMGLKEESPNQAISHVFQTSIDNFLADEGLSEEVFGPASVLVSYTRKEDILEAARELSGHLTATVHATEADIAEHQELFDILTQKVGRVVLNGFPTGVEVCPSMVHGGPYPATSAPQSTSVGTNAIKRFVRPVCFQGYPDTLLPDALKNENPLEIWRLVDGSLTKDKI